MYFTAGEISEKLCLSINTVRQWYKKGLIRAKKSNQGSLIYSISEIKRLQERIERSSENRYKILQSDRRTLYRAIDLFAGAGGTALGFHNAGIEHVLLTDMNKDCIEALKKNCGSWGADIICDDIANIDFKKKYCGSIDLVQGGFPCQAFSYAGKKLGLNDVRGTLFFEFVRCVKEVRPKIAVAENVKGLVKHDNGRTLEFMVASLEELGYVVKYKVLKAQYFDVPQKRERLFIIGTRKDLGIEPIFPEENNHIVPLRDALHNCPESQGQTYSQRKCEIMKLVPQGGYWKDLPVEIQKEYMGASFYHTGGRTGIARRLSWDEPSLTLTCSPSQKQTERCHPKETRPFTVREYARIQTFPDNWEFAGSLSSQYKQIGNAVPVNLAYHLGSSVVSTLNGLTKRAYFDRRMESEQF